MNSKVAHYLTLNHCVAVSTSDQLHQELNLQPIGEAGFEHGYDLNEQKLVKNKTSRN
ncbi:hypothetical protein J2S05_000191 [Alkalicoccobacillus murimartini]|uniref:Uncharacterized protein n=1 Tax=Alkalicoccobacillus murimartini TaxID=171685 RepID=A0ABT9YC48_9BACI|nr:hypothetical protein [Alkalicoccobacillus murimartini]